MKRLLIVLTIVAVSFLALIPRGHAVTPRKKKAIEQHCTVVDDLRADEIAAAVKKLNGKGIRVQETQIRELGGKFAIVVLDGQDDPCEEGESDDCDEDEEDGSPAIRE